MRPHLISKVLSLYDRVVHHQPAPVAPEPEAAGDGELDVDVDVAGDDAQLDDTSDDTSDDDTRATLRMGAYRDEGDLYGVHTPAASDRTLPDDDRAFESGQNWIEALEERSAEGGPLPEHEIDVVDEADDKHPHTERKDRPIADLGSGGRGGL
jgi:hypothetical protein